MGQQKIFFSYSRMDASEFSLRLYNDLKKTGANVWIDQIDIQVGRRWDIEIGKALETCECLIFIVSEKSVESDNVLDEVYYAIDEKKEVVPIIISSCPVPYRLRRFQQLNFINNYNNGLELLSKILNLNELQQEKIESEKKDENKKKLTDIQIHITELQKADTYFKAEDFEKASVIYLKYSEKLNGEQCNNLGWMYDTGIGIEENLVEAMKWYRKAVEQGNSNAMTNIAAMYHLGNGVTRNYLQAYDWYMKAAEKSNKDAMFSIGCMYEKGEGVRQDYVEAFKWIEKAAKAGNTDAMISIGVMYNFGERKMKKDIKEAFKWYNMAAEEGDSVAMNQIGCMYEKGEGVEKNKDEAVSWFKKAKRKGNEDAANNLKRLGIKY